MQQLWLLALLCQLPAACSGSSVLSAPAARASDVRLRRAVLEVRRYLYELSGEIALLDDVGGGAPLPADAMPRVLVSNVDELGAVHPSLMEPPDQIPQTAGSHFVQLVTLPTGPLVVCSGIDSTATLYAVYSLMEALGVRFRNHGDVIPRGGRGHGLAALFAPAHLLVQEKRIWQSPNMALRGSQPFADFPAGPDWWGVEEYKHFFEQMAKSKSNFLGLHTYHNEPTVWQDSTDVSHFDSHTGNITRVQTYPRTQYTYTTTLGGWGQNATGAGWTATPGATSGYLYGSAQMYHADCYGTPAVMGDPELCPNPTSENAQARIFNNVGAMLKDAFQYARTHLGFQTAVGTEAPRASFFGGSGMNDRMETLVHSYEAVFKRIESAYPIDWWWSWTPEGYIWNEGSASPIGAMEGAPVVAGSCPPPGPIVPGSVQWSGLWRLNASSDESYSTLSLASPCPLAAGEWCLKPCNGTASCAPGDLPVMTVCDPNDHAQHWVFNSSTALMHAAADTSLCLESASCTHNAAGGTWWCQGPRVSIQTCRPEYTGQQWDWKSEAAHGAEHEVSSAVPIGTKLKLESCDMTNPAQWSTQTTTKYTTAVTQLALDKLSCLNCPGVGQPCHTWGCSNLASADARMDRNGVFFLKEEGGGFQIRSYPNTTLIPIGPGQAGPGYCITAAVRGSGSEIELQKCDLAKRETQIFQLAINGSSVVQLPRDNAAQPPLKALCVVAGSPPGPSPSPHPATGHAGILNVRGPIKWGQNGCLACAPTPACNSSWGADGYRQKECGLADFQAMITAHRNVKPAFGLAVSGWTMGPGPESFPPGNATWLNDKLPPSVAISAINPECGNVPPNPGLAGMTSHSTWTIPWMEDDGGQNEPQFWVNRTLEWGRQATAYNSSGGLFGIHWRTRAISLQFSALAQYPWNPGLTSRQFYVDFCQHDFGLGGSDADACAALFDDGKLDPTCKRHTTPACAGPTRPPMQGLPGAIKADPSDWKTQQPRYAFVDTIAKMDALIHGPENRERWMYWLSMLKSLQADAQYATLWGAFNAAIAKAGAETDPSKRQNITLTEAMPLRIQMVQQAETALLWKMNTTSTTGGLGAVANFNQFVLRNSLAVEDCTSQAASQGCLNNTRMLKEYSGIATLPAAAMPVDTFRGVERGFVLSPRGSCARGRVLTVRYIALLGPASVGRANATLHYRKMGSNGAFTPKPMGSVRSVFTADLGGDGGMVEDTEYFVSVSGAKEALQWPPGAPDHPHTVIVV